MVLNVAIIGSGFGGLGAAIRLRESQIHDFVVFERADDLGGTWRDNAYPGCRCDVASNLYSFSFAPNPRWSNTFSYQPEIWRYLQDVATRHDLRKYIKFNHDVTDISFDANVNLWTITTSQGRYVARSVILATGGLAEPRLPEISGVDTFTGPIMHTARWDSSIDLAGKRVAVIGTGASAVQTVPQIAPIVAHLDVFQRTPSWVLPHQGHPVLDRTKRLFALFPFAQKLNRAYGYWKRELLLLGFVKDPSRMTRAETIARDHLARQVPDPNLREKLTPSYRLGCKRVLLSNDYYPALVRDNVSLITDHIACIEPRGVRTTDGTMHEYDVIIAATGFFVTDNPMGERVHGTGGETMAEAWRGDMANYKGTMFPGFPNLFMLSGPNTSLGHSSIIFMLESQLNYVMDAMNYALKNDVRIEPTPEAAQRWTTSLQEKLPGTVWGTGCSSWYLNERGRNTTIWPDFTFRFRAQTRRFELRDHLKVR
ncbi:MAG: flavin-containing monooxygenase [Acidimicrobiales bacterium]